MINIKLDKTGGLTEALKLAQAAQAQGLGIMVYCMVGTSLAMAPAMLLASFVQYIDLNGPLLLARDREHACVSMAAKFIFSRRNRPLATYFQIDMISQSSHHSGLSPGE
jgi:L-alanine-DL-glutamate epimerase-like enolase superfamily enzyme